MHDLNPLRGAGQLQRGELVFRAHEPGAKGYALPSMALRAVQFVPWMPRHCPPLRRIAPMTSPMQSQ